MHEAAIAGNIVESAARVADEHGGLPISRIVVELGVLQHIVPEALNFAFEAAVHGTPHVGAELVWREVPARIACDVCGMEYEPEDVFWLCPECGAVGGTVLQGEELVLRSVELDEGTEG